MSWFKRKKEELTASQVAFEHARYVQEEQKSRQRQMRAFEGDSNFYGLGTISPLGRNDWYKDGNSNDPNAAFKRRKESE